MKQEVFMIKKDGECLECKASGEYCASKCPLQINMVKGKCVVTCVNDILKETNKDES